MKGAVRAKVEYIPHMNDVTSVYKHKGSFIAIDKYQRKTCQCLNDIEHPCFICLNTVAMLSKSTIISVFTATKSPTISIN